MAEPYVVPDWLEEWEKRPTLIHPEARADNGPTHCPQCSHVRHYGVCPHRLVSTGKSLCSCPGLKWLGQV